MATQTVAGPTAAGTPNAALLEGAAACHRMMSSIEELELLDGPAGSASEGDDGKRRDYARADLAVSAALDAFADNTGFRVALSNYLLMVNHDGRPVTAAWSAETLLTDGGNRPSCAEVPADTVQRGVDLTADKVGAALSATWEIEALCDSGRDLAAGLGAMDDAAASRAELKLRGLFARLEQLNSALMSVLDDDIETADLQRKVFGRVTEQGGGAMGDTETRAKDAGEVGQAATLPGHLVEARDRAVAQAAREVEIIAAMLRRGAADLADFADAEYLLPGNLMRVEALGWALTILTGHCRDCPDDIAEQYSVVFGKPLEALDA